MDKKIINPPVLKNISVINNSLVSYPIELVELLKINVIR
jgi:hypothetical protein